MPDDAELLCECVSDYCESERVPLWKLILLAWFFLA